MVNIAFNQESWSVALEILPEYEKIYYKKLNSKY